MQNRVLYGQVFAVDLRRYPAISALPVKRRCRRVNEMADREPCFDDGLGYPKSSPKRAGGRGGPKPTKVRSDQDDRFESDASIPEDVKKKTVEDRERLKIPPHTYGYEYGPGFAEYDARRDLVVLGVFVKPYRNLGKIDAESCIGIVEDLRHEVRSGDSTEATVSRWFSHSGYQSAPKLAKDLADHTTVLIYLDWYAITDAEVRCEQPLAGGEVSVVKKKPK
jgi:hypothetical protein